MTQVLTESKTVGFFERKKELLQIVCQCHCIEVAFLWLGIRNKWTVMSFFHKIDILKKPEY